MNPTTWQQGARAAIRMINHNDEPDLVAQLRELFDCSDHDDVHYDEMAEIALRGLSAATPSAIPSSDGQLLDETLTLITSKQRDYGNDNVTRFGHAGLGIRIHDKIARLENLANKNPDCEAVVDTWQDVLGYCIIGIMVSECTFNLPLEGMPLVDLDLDEFPNQQVPKAWAQYTQSVYR